MKEVWIVYEEAFPKDKYHDTILRNVRTFDSFEKAKKAMAEQIQCRAATNSIDFNHRGWNIHKIIDEIVNDKAFQKATSEEDLALTRAYLTRFFDGEAGELDVQIAGVRVSAFSRGRIRINASGWEDSGYGIYAKRLPSFFAEIPTLDINAFLMDNPDKKYYCFARRWIAELDEPYYMYLSLSKVEVE